MYNAIWIAKPEMDKTIGIKVYCTEKELKEKVLEYASPKLFARKNFGAFIQSNTDRYFFIEFQALPVKSWGRPDVSGEDYKWMMDFACGVAFKFNLYYGNPFEK